MTAAYAFAQYFLRRIVMRSIYDGAYCYGRFSGLSVCLSVGRSVWNETITHPAKTAEPIEMPCGMWGGVGDSHHVLDGLSLIHI